MLAIRLTRPVAALRLAIPLVSAIPRRFSSSDSKTKLDPQELQQQRKAKTSDKSKIARMKSLIESNSASKSHSESVEPLKTLNRRTEIRVVSKGGRAGIRGRFPGLERGSQTSQGESEDPFSWVPKVPHTALRNKEDVFKDCFYAGHRPLIGYSPLSNPEVNPSFEFKNVFPFDVDCELVTKNKEKAASKAPSAPRPFSLWNSSATGKVAFSEMNGVPQSFVNKLKPFVKPEDLDLDED